MNLFQESELLVTPKPTSLEYFCVYSLGSGRFYEEDPSIINFAGALNIGMYYINCQFSVRMLNCWGFFHGKELKNLTFLSCVQLGECEASVLDKNDVC